MATRTKVIKDDNLIEMFNQMALGNGDPEIVAAKLVKMHAALNIIRSVTKDFAGGPLFRAFPEHKS